MDKENTNGLNGAVVMEDEVANYYEVLGVDVGVREAPHNSQFMSDCVAGLSQANKERVQAQGSCVSPR